MHTVRWVSEQLGLAPGTLRAWEQRYGIVHPTRSEGGYRLYDDNDLDTLQAMADLVRRIKQEQIPAVFAEADYNPKLLEVLGREAGVTVVTDLYDDSLSAGPPADSYLNLMRHDVTTIVTALQ